MELSECGWCTEETLEKSDNQNEKSKKWKNILDIKIIIIFCKAELVVVVDMRNEIL